MGRGLIRARYVPLLFFADLRPFVGAVEWLIVEDQTEVSYSSQVERVQKPTITVV